MVETLSGCEAYGILTEWYLEPIDGFKPTITAMALRCQYGKPGEGGAAPFMLTHLGLVNQKMYRSKAAEG